MDRVFSQTAGQLQGLMLQAFEKDEDVNSKQEKEWREDIKLQLKQNYTPHKLQPRKK